MALPEIDQVIEDLKSQLINIGTKGVMTYLMTQSPFFSIPIIKLLVSSIVKSVIEITVRYTELGAYFIYVDTFTEAQVEALKASMLVNKLAQESGDNEAKKKAENDLVASARAIIKFAH